MKRGKITLAFVTTFSINEDGHLLIQLPKRINSCIIKHFFEVSQTTKHNKSLIITINMISIIRGTQVIQCNDILYENLSRCITDAKNVKHFQIEDMKLRYSFLEPFCIYSFYELIKTVVPRSSIPLMLKCLIQTV